MRLTCLYKEEISRDKIADLYFDAIDNYYNSPGLIQLITQGEEVAKQMAGSSSINTDISNSGNLIIRYIITDDTIFLLGIVTLKGKLTRTDLADYNRWVNELLSKLKEGYILMSSPNDLSMPLMRKVIKSADRMGMNLNVEEMGEMKMGGMTWKNIVVTNEDLE